MRWLLAASLALWLGSGIGWASEQGPTAAAYAAAMRPCLTGFAVSYDQGLEQVHFERNGTESWMWRNPRTPQVDFRAYVFVLYEPDEPKPLTILMDGPKGDAWTNYVEWRDDVTQLAGCFYVTQEFGRMSGVQN